MPVSVQHFVVNGADRHMMYRKPEPIIDAVLRIVRKWRRSKPGESMKEWEQWGFGVCVSGGGVYEMGDGWEREKEKEGGMEAERQSYRERAQQGEKGNGRTRQHIKDGETGERDAGRNIVRSVCNITSRLTRQQKRGEMPTILQFSYLGLYCYLCNMRVWLSNDMKIETLIIFLNVCVKLCQYSVESTCIKRSQVWWLKDLCSFWVPHGLFPMKIAIKETSMTALKSFCCFCCFA